MAIQNKLVDLKLQIRVEDTSTGETKVKNLNFTRIKCAATNDELYAAAKMRSPRCSPARCRASARWRPAIWLTLSSTATTKTPRAFP